MSYSSLWVMDQTFHGSDVGEFSNSWLLTPVAMDILFQKYMPEKAFNNGEACSYLPTAMFDRRIEQNLNQLLNESANTEDRILWELAMQQVFSSKDKAFVAKCLQNFLKNNETLTKELGEHIHERFDEVAEAILEINEKKYPYFIFKGTSVDDSVEIWFKKYNEENQKRVERTLCKVDKVVCEFVLIENEEIKGFINNIHFFEHK